MSVIHWEESANDSSVWIVLELIRGKTRESCRTMLTISRNKTVQLWSPLWLLGLSSCFLFDFCTRKLLICNEVVTLVFSLYTIRSNAIVVAMFFKMAAEYGRCNISEYLKVFSIKHLTRTHLHLTLESWLRIAKFQIYTNFYM